MERKLRVSIRGIARFIIVFGLILWMWWFFRSYLLFVALFIMCCGVTVSLPALWIGKDRLRACAVLPQGRVGREVEFSFDICVHNPIKWLGFAADIQYSWGNVFTDNFQSKRERIWIKAGKTTTFHQFLRSRYAGRLEVRIEQFIVYDFFHIFYITGCGCENAGVIAYPVFLPDDVQEIAACVEGFPKEEESKRRGSDYNPDYEVREYIEGDELKSIHWKLTAKKSQLMVRERLSSGRHRMNVVVPLGNDKAENDALMDSLYSVCHLLIKKEYPIQIFWSMGSRGLQSHYLAEQGELENIVGQILSSRGTGHTEDIREQMAVSHPHESYILIQTGAYKGAYIK